jgi:hypothetical protein
MRFFFHVKDGKERLDQDGVELIGMSAVKTEAVIASTELLGAISSPDFWTGEPWKLWVTDQPNGAGKTFLTLTFSAQLSDTIDSPNDHLTDTSGPH